MYNTVKKSKEEEEPTKRILTISDMIHHNDKNESSSKLLDNNNTDNDDGNESLASAPKTLPSSLSMNSLLSFLLSTEERKILVKRIKHKPNLHRRRKVS
jgi:hypothetical protein